jgi:hypothetical protein
MLGCVEAESSARKERIAYWTLVLRPTGGLRDATAVRCVRKPKGVGFEQGNF